MDKIAHNREVNAPEKERIYYKNYILSDTSC